MTSLFLLNSLLAQYHNAPLLPPKNLNTHCFRFPLGHLHVPGEIANNHYAKFWGVKEVYYGICASRECLRNRKHVLCFYRVIQTRVEVWENEKFFEFSQTFTSACITIETRSTCLFLLENKVTRKRKQLVNFDYQNVNSLYSCHHYVNSVRWLCLHRVIRTQFLTNQRACFLRTVFQKQLLDSV